MRRLWILARIAETFHISPLQAARELDEDPEQLNLACLTLLSYRNAKAAFDDAKGDVAKLKAWDGDPMMDQVVKNTFTAHKERLVHRTEHQSFVPSCRYCVKEASQ